MYEFRNSCSLFLNYYQKINHVENISRLHEYYLKCTEPSYYREFDSCKDVTELKTPVVGKQAYMHK